MRRRFRRFRRGLVKRQRPTWRRAFDLSLGAAFTNPCTAFATIPGNTQFPAIAGGVAGTSYCLLGGAPFTAASSVVVVGGTDLDFFEGELSMLRLMGYLRCYGVFTNDAATGDANRRIEVRAWLYKTWEQEVDNRIGLIHPFNVEDFSGRVLWSATWGFILKSTADIEGASIDNMGSTRCEAWINHEIFGPGPAVGASLEGSHVSPVGWAHQIRRIGIRRSVKVKGNERIALAFAAGPFLNPATITVPIGGMARMLIRH